MSRPLAGSALAPLAIASAASAAILLQSFTAHAMEVGKA